MALTYGYIRKTISFVKYKDLTPFLEPFSIKRAKRIDWIKAALQDTDAELYVGWDGRRKRYDRRHRVTLVVGNYVVVIRLSGIKKAQFVTAYVADSPSTLQKIKRNPKWGSLKIENR